MLGDSPEVQVRLVAQRPQQVTGCFGVQSGQALCESGLAPIGSMVEQVVPPAGRGHVPAVRLAVTELLAAGLAAAAAGAAH